jgi:hypothetical protein
MSPSADNPAPLSVHLAFVVQFRTNTQLEAGHLTGRVEHVTSRQVMECNSLEALLAFVARVLREARETSSATGTWHTSASLRTSLRRSREGDGRRQQP